MSVLSRVNYTAQQRVDLHHFLMQESFTAFDFRSIVSTFVGTDKSYVIRGFEVVGKTGLSVQIRVADSQVFNPRDNNGSFYMGLPDDADITVDLPADQANVFVEGRFRNQTQAPVNSAFWDPLALTGEDASGTEFSASTNTQNVIVLEISVNTIGFSEGAIKIARFSTNASAITDAEDRREMMLRLGQGGDTPNPLHKYEWSSSRGESVPNGTGVGDAVDSPWRARDSVGAINDKAFRSLKEWMDAVMTRFSEISGSALWYTAGLATAPVSNVSLNQTFFDSLGHNIQPSADAAFIWKRVSGTLRLAGEGTVPLVSGSHHVGLVRWQSNYSKLEWHLGGTFASATFRNYTSGAVRFTSPAPVDKGNIYLKLEREVPKGSGANVSWADNSADTRFVSTKAVSGQAGDFTGIALGDFIRKESEGYSRYYRVVKMSYGPSQLTPYDNAIVTDENRVADSTIVALELEDTILGALSTEPLRFFRSRYSDADLYADASLGVYLYQDADFYWLGRRVGDLFTLRGYGTMQEGEEATTLDDSFRGNSSGDGGLVLEHAKQAAYHATNGYSLLTGSGDLVTIRRRKSDNTTETPGSGDNSDALLTYTIAAPVGLMSLGDQLWVRLSETADGALSSGPVTNSADELDNTDVNTNLWEIRPASTTPLRTHDTRNVFLLARRVVIGGQAALIFADGSVLGAYGNLLNQNVEITGETKLTPRTQQGVLFIHETIPGQVDDEAAQLFYTKSSGTFGVRTFRITDNNILLSAAASVNFLTNLGNYTLTVGDASSTTYIPGDLVVAGNTVAAQVSQIQSEDKVITLGVGNPLNGGYDSGIEVADNTINGTQFDSTNLSPDVVITLASAPGYSLSDIIGVSATTGIGGITAGQIGGQYTIVAALSAPGEATISGTTLTVRTAVSATSTATSSTTPPKAFKAEWSLKVSGADGSLAGITSWRFQVKGVATTPTLTPVSGYGIVPTAHSTNMQVGRLAFVNNDNAGPSGADSTLNFDSNLVWDGSGLTVGGYINPKVDNLYDLGAPAFRWKTLHVGPGSVVVHNDATDTLYLRARFNGADASLDTDAATSLKISSLQTFLQTNGLTAATIRSNRAVNVEPLASDPVSAVIGDHYYSSVSRKLRFNDGIGWLDTDLGDISGEVTGYEDRNDSTFSFDNGTRTFSILPIGASYDYYIRGTRYRETGTKSIVLPNVTGLYFIYFDTAQALQQTTSFSTALLQSFAYTATVYWNATTAEAEFLSEERHGLTMDGETHAYLHLTQGTRYVSGLTLTPNAALGGDGSVDSQAQVAMTGGVIRDEDISITIVDDPTPTAFFEQILGSTAQIPVAYRIGASGNWQKDTATLFPLKAGAARPRWNEFTGGAWQLTDASANGKFIAYWIFATNDVNSPIISVMGQAEYNDLSSAQAGALYELLSFGSLPFQEFKLLFRMIYRTDATYANAIKAAAYHIQDYRRSTDPNLSSSYMPSDHGNLSGNGDDDHLQYLLLAGRAGGQTAYGGIGSGDNLVLRSTSHATKGQVWLDESTQSTSITTGAFRVTGGAGVGMNLWVGGETASTGALRALDAFRLEKQQTVTANTTLTSASCVVMVDTSAAVADITITLPLSASAKGQVIIMKDFVGYLSYLNKRAYVAVQAPDVLIADQIHGVGTPFLWDIDFSSLTLISDGSGRWIMV